MKNEIIFDFMIIERKFPKKKKKKKKKFNIQDVYMQHS